MKKFIEFLKKENAWDTFKKNIKERSEGLISYVNFLKKKGMENAVSAAFEWHKTNEGSKHWSKIDTKWREIEDLETTLVKLWEND